MAVCGDRALLMFGPSEAGKTSLLIGLATSGARAYTDEIALIASDDLRIHSFPRDLIVHSGTQSKFPEILFEQSTWKYFCSYRFVSPVAFKGYGQEAPAVPNCVRLVRLKPPVDCCNSLLVYGTGVMRRSNCWGDWSNPVLRAN